MALSIVREVSERVPPPRAVFMRFPFGHALGEPGNAAQHHAVLGLAMQALFEVDAPGAIRDAGLRWRREQYAPPDWDALKRLGPR